MFTLQELKVDVLAFLVNYFTAVVTTAFGTKVI